MIINALEQSFYLFPSSVFVGIYSGVYYKKNKKDFFNNIKKINWSQLFFFLSAVLIAFLSEQLRNMNLLNWMVLILSMIFSGLFAFYLASLRNTRILLISYLTFFALTASLFTISFLIN